MLKKLSSHFEAGDSIALSNVEVKKSRVGEEFELLVKKNTRVSKSPTTFNVDLAAQDSVVDIAEIEQIKLFKKVTVNVKVVKVEDVITANNGKAKQNVMVADASGFIRVTRPHQLFRVVSIKKFYHWLFF